MEADAKTVRVSRGHALTLRQLGRYAIARSLFPPTSLPRAIARLGFVQADPMRAPARAQDLILAHRVTGYRAGDLERRYPRLAVEEAFFVKCDAELNPPDVRDRGQLVIEIGMAPVKPAEFVIFRLSQFSGGGA